MSSRKKTSSQETQNRKSVQPTAASTNPIHGLSIKAQWLWPVLLLAIISRCSLLYFPVLLFCINTHLSLQNPITSFDRRISISFVRHPVPVLWNLRGITLHYVASVGATQYSVPWFVRDSPVDVAPQVMRFHLKHWPPPRETRAAISSSCQPPQLSDLFCRRTTRFQEARAFIYCIQNQTREISSSTHVPRRLLRLLYLFPGPRNEMRWGELRCVPPYFSMVSWLGVYQQQQHHATFNDLEKPFNRTRSSSSPPSDVSWLNSGLWWLQINDGVSFFSIPGLEFA